MLTFQVNADTLAWKEVVLWGHIWAITAHFPRNTGNCPRSPSLKLALHQKQCSCKFLGLKTALSNTIQTTTKVNNYNYLRLKPYIILPKCLPDQFLFMKVWEEFPHSLLLYTSTDPLSRQPSCACVCVLWHLLYLTLFVLP